MLVKINKKDLKTLKELLENNNINYDLYSNPYKVIAYEEAQAALDYEIENEDLFITKDDYMLCLEELADDIYNNDEDIMQELTSLSRDLAYDILKQRKILVV